MPVYFRFITGYIYLRITGEDKLRFLNMLRNRKLYTWDIKKDDDNIYTYMLYDEFMNISHTGYEEKYAVRIEVVKEYGMRMWLKKNRKRAAFLAGPMAMYIIISWMSGYIWEVNIQGNFLYTKEEILKKVDAHNVGFGTQKSKIVCDDIEKLLRQEYDDFTWVSVEIKGSRLNIYVKENEGSVVKEADTTPCDVVATADGIVTEIITRRGTPLVHKGDQVTKGQVLVSSEVALLNDAGEVIRVNNVHADADVYISYSFDYSESIPLKYNKKIYTGNNKEIYCISIMDYYIKGIFNKRKDMKYEIVTEFKENKLLKNLGLSAFISKINIQEFEFVEALYSDAEAEKLINEEIAYFFDKINEKGIQIIENNVKIEKDSDYIKASGNLILQENAVAVKPPSEDSLITDTDSN